MADVNVYTNFDFHNSLDWTGGTALIKPSKVTLSKGANVETFHGSFYVSGQSLGGSVDSIDFKISGKAQWDLSGSYDAGTAQNYVLAPGGTQAYYGYLLRGDDTIHSRGAGAVLDGYDGGNTAVYDLAKSSVNASLETGTAKTAAGTDKLFHFSNLTGSAFADSLTGNAGRNMLDGGAGADVMSGGKGDDSYEVDNNKDVIVERAGGGHDNVNAYIDSYVLAANVEDLRSTGTKIIGNALDNRLTVVQGSSGRDVLLDGGAGADTMVDEGDSNDTYIVDNRGDHVFEGVAGKDTVKASVSYTAPDGIETLMLTGTGNINATTNSSLACTLIGNAGSNVLDGSNNNNYGLYQDERADLLVGGEGNDTYIIGQVDDKVVEKAGGGIDTVVWNGFQLSVATSYTLNQNIENLTLGSGVSNGYGNSLDNVLTGDAENNRLDGKLGSDTLIGAGGDDTYVIDSTGDRVVEHRGAGTDAVESGISYVLGANVENLSLIGHGAINATGNDQSNVLTGNDADNRLDGGGGSDEMSGGRGDDTYVVNTRGDQVVEAPKGGHDSVESSISYGLSYQLEDLTLIGKAAINGTGNASDNLITGNEAANKLDGGAGADSMRGLGGDDIYVVDSSGDRVVESVNGGLDTVQSSVDYTLGGSVEGLVLTGSHSIDGTGNSADNTITGNKAANLLDGRGGSDTMSGGAGNDHYVVDSAGDVVIETTSGGHDIVQSSVSTTLAANVEDLTLTGKAYQAIGNELDNELVGNHFRNSLDGRGGDDVMRGLEGNDSYVVDSAGDRVVEGVDGGNDGVYSSISFTLGDNVEELLLAGNASINATGNALDNRLTGNHGNNVLNP